MTYLKAPCDGCGTVIEWVEPDLDLPRHCGCCDLNVTLDIARKRENKFNIPHYVVHSVPCRGYVVTDSMPYMGEWYSTDGVQHGSAVPA